MFLILQMKTHIRDNHAEYCKKKNSFLDFTDENSQSRTCKECEEKNVFDFKDNNSYKRQSCRISKNRNKWFEPKSF